MLFRSLSLVACLASSAALTAGASVAHAEEGVTCSVAVYECGKGEYCETLTCDKAVKELSDVESVEVTDGDVVFNFIGDAAGAIVGAITGILGEGGSGSGGDDDGGDDGGDSDGGTFHVDPDRTAGGVIFTPGTCGRRCGSTL